jgi:hypothetical protein
MIVVRRHRLLSLPLAQQVNIADGTLATLTEPSLLDCSRRPLTFSQPLSFLLLLHYLGRTFIVRKTKAFRENTKGTPGLAANLLIRPSLGSPNYRFPIAP